MYFKVYLLSNHLSNQNAYTKVIIYILKRAIYFMQSQNLFIHIVFSNTSYLKTQIILEDLTFKLIFLNTIFILHINIIMSFSARKTVKNEHNILYLNSKVLNVTQI